MLSFQYAFWDTLHIFACWKSIQQIVCDILVMNENGTRLIRTIQAHTTECWSFTSGMENTKSKICQVNFSIKNFARIKHPSMLNLCPRCLSWQISFTRKKKGTSTDRWIRENVISFRCENVTRGYTISLRFFHRVKGSNSKCLPRPQIPVSQKMSCKFTHAAFSCCALRASTGAPTQMQETVTALRVVVVTLTTRRRH